MPDRIRSESGAPLVALALLVLTLGLVLACSAPSIVVPTPTPIPTATPIPSAAHKTIVFCADETPSYPADYFHSATNKMADWVQALVKPAQDGVTLYARWINYDSYSDQTAAGAVVKVPAIGPDAPAPEQGATAPPLRADLARTATIEAHLTQTAYVTQHAAIQKQVQAAQADVQKQLQQVRGMPYRDRAPSDIWGCPQRATDLLPSNLAGAKYLVIASDMEIAGPQEDIAVRLQGVTVFVINFKCDSAASCYDKENYWRPALMKAGASSVTFLERSDTEALDQLFS